jgi:hypothetical protein
VLRSLSQEVEEMRAQQGGLAEAMAAERQQTARWQGRVAELEQQKEHAVGELLGQVEAWEGEATLRAEEGEQSMVAVATVQAEAHQLVRQDDTGHTPQRAAGRVS